MWKLEPPRISTTTVVDLCVLQSRRPDECARLLADLPILKKNRLLYKRLANQDTLHSGFLDLLELTSASRKDMRYFYKQRIAKEGRPGRAIYDQLLLGARNDMCCYCDSVEADTLDHVVPQSVLPSLSVEPLNLVPSCARCNKKLGDRFPSDPHKGAIHPYFSPDIGRWLYAKVVESDPVSFVFFAKPEATLARSLRKRISTQFTQLELAKRYRVLAARLVSETNRSLQRPGQSYFLLGKDAVREELSQRAIDTFGKEQNDYRGAFYEALAASDWYCRGGAVSTPKA